VGKWKLFLERGGNPITKDPWFDSAPALPMFYQLALSTHSESITLNILRFETQVDISSSHIRRHIQATNLLLSI
jgi:hypothetical protein